MEGVKEEECQREDEMEEGGGRVTERTERKRISGERKREKEKKRKEDEV